LIDTHDPETLFMVDEIPGACRVNALTGSSEVAPFPEDTLQLVLRSRNGALVHLGSGFQAGKNKKDAGSSSIVRMGPGSVHYLSFSFNGKV